jgi:hypothetical protein
MENNFMNSIKRNLLEFFKILSLIFDIQQKYTTHSKHNRVLRTSRLKSFKVITLNMKNSKLQQ